MKVLCLLGNQLFNPSLLPVKTKDKVVIFMREDRDLCEHFKYHKHKIIFFLSAMRKYAKELKTAGFKVHYEELGQSEEDYSLRLQKFMKGQKSNELLMFEIEDKFFESKIKNWTEENKIKLETIQSPMFLTTREQFLEQMPSSKKPFMKTFYESQRKRLNILLDSEGQPTGGQWSFDNENRKSLPKKHQCPEIPQYRVDEIDKKVLKIVDENFAQHPGSSLNFWLPTDRAGAHKWLQCFLKERFSCFGPYEDALSKEYPFVYHSVLTPFLNVGLLTPEQCITEAIDYANKHQIPLNSCEGFVRQIIGWREFIRGIYQNYSEQQESTNFFSHHKKLTSLWYEGDTGIEPLDDVIKKTIKYGYAHHIERLMVVGSLMLLLEVDPKEAHRWFMEMFIDSSDWVMGPNVFGMALFSDGGIFATKPYICGSNYYRKMSNYKKKDWCDGVDGLYWGFIGKHKDSFAKNHRMAMMVRMHEKMDKKRLTQLDKAAEQLRGLLVQ